jgi:AraC family ethanolamine operon transcriptional activator
MHLRQLITQAFQALSTMGPQHTQAAAARHMQDGIVLAWQEALGDACAPEAFDAASLAQRRAVVSRCCEHAQDRLPEPTSLLALCQHVGVSARKLNHCFHDVLGMAPARYLRLMRLNGAHQDLLAHTRRGTRHTVVDIAGQWGFWHMGAFASDYRRLFGRLPSQAHQPCAGPMKKALTRRAFCQA